MSEQKVNESVSQNPDTNQDYREIGIPGLKFMQGYIEEAHNKQLYWPVCFDEYNQIYRGDPEIAMMRQVIASLVGRQTLEYELSEEIDAPTSDDELLVEVGNQMLEDIGTNGPMDFVADCMTNVPFWGFGLWEIVKAPRAAGWSDPETGWTSRYDDFRIGVRDLAWRSYRSFDRWELTPQGRVKGFYQVDPNDYKEIFIPSERTLHITFGTTNNPEGIPTLEPIWRLARIKKGLELVQGIGFEHSAGYLQFKSSDIITEDDKAAIRNAARAVMTAQHQNYLTLPEGLDAEIMDVGFSAAGSILEAIRYYGVMKLGILAMQWIAMGSLSPYGSYSAMNDASNFWLSIYKSLSEGMIGQLNQQLQPVFFSGQNTAGMNYTKLPVLHLTPVEKTRELADILSFVKGIHEIASLTPKDVVALRGQAEFLPVIPDEEIEIVEKLPFMPFGGGTPKGNSSAQPEQEEENPPKEELLSLRPFHVSSKEHWTSIIPTITQDHIRAAKRRWDKWCDNTRRPSNKDFFSTTRPEAGLAEKKPRYIYDPAADAFRNTINGQFVSRKTILALSEEYRVEVVKEEVKRLTDKMIAGDLPLELWQDQLANLIKHTAITEYALGHGSVELADLIHLSSQLQSQYRRIEGLAQASELGMYSAAQFSAYTAQIAASTRTMYMLGQRISQKDAGKVWERRIVNPMVENCPDCLSLESLSWQPINTLPLPGQGSVCDGNCYCEMEYTDEAEL